MKNKIAGCLLDSGRILATINNGDKEQRKVSEIQSKVYSDQRIIIICQCVILPRKYESIKVFLAKARGRRKDLTARGFHQADVSN